MRQQTHKRRVFDFIKSKGDAGATPDEIMKFFNIEERHKGGTIAHALTDLYKNGEINRIKSPDVHPNSFRYYRVNTMKIKDHILSIIAQNPGIKSQKIGELLSLKIGKKTGHTTYLLKLTKEGRINREVVNGDILGLATYRYWIADPVQKALVLEGPAPDNLDKTLENLLAPPNNSSVAFAVFNDGRSIIETASVRIELTAEETEKFRKLLKANPSN